MHGAGSGCRCVKDEIRWESALIPHPWLRGSDTALEDPHGAVVRHRGIHMNAHAVPAEGTPQ